MFRGVVVRKIDSQNRIRLWSLQGLQKALAVIPSRGRLLFFYLQDLKEAQSGISLIQKAFYQFDTVQWDGLMRSARKLAIEPKGMRIKIPRDLLDAREEGVSEVRVVGRGRFVEIIHPGSEEVLDRWDEEGEEQIGLFRDQASESCRTRPEKKRVGINQVDDGNQEYRSAARWDFDELKRSIQEQGQKEPVLLAGGRPPYKILRGHQRVAVVKSLNRKSILAVIMKDCPDSFCREIHAVLESSVRSESKRPIEWIRTASRLASQNTTVREIALAMDLGQRTVRDYLQLGRAPKTILDSLERGDLTIYQALEAMRAGLGASDLEALKNGVLSIRSIREKRNRLPRGKAVRKRGRTLRRKVAARETQGENR